MQDIKVLVDDIYLNNNQSHISFDVNPHDQQENYTMKVFKKFIDYLKSFGFICEMDKATYMQDCKKNNIFIHTTSFGRSIDVDVYYLEKYNSGKTYLEKLATSLYAKKCFDWFVKYKKEQKIDFTYNGKIRNYQEKNKMDKYLTSEKKIINHFRESCWHKPSTKNEDFKLSMWDGTTFDHNAPDECGYDFKINCNNHDRDNKIIKNGEIKYFRDYYGHLSKGKVYHNINNMWWVICNDKLYYNKACFELFDLTDDDLKYKRYNPDLKPKKYLDMLSIDSPENQIRKILESKITPRKLGQLFSEYCENRCIEQRNYKLKTAPEQWYFAEGKCWSWNKVSCRLKTENKYFEIVFRQDDYIIIYFDEERVFELDAKIRHWNKEKLAYCFQKYNNLFKSIISSINRMIK